MTTEETETNGVQSNEPAYDIVTAASAFAQAEAAVKAASVNLATAEAALATARSAELDARQRMNTLLGNAAVPVPQEKKCLR